MSHACFLTLLERELSLLPTRLKSSRVGGDFACLNVNVCYDEVPWIMHAGIA